MTILLFFFFNDTATTEIYTLSLHDALPIFVEGQRVPLRDELLARRDHLVVRPHRLEQLDHDRLRVEDRKSTRLNSSHANISYAVFCLKKKKNKSDTACTRNKSHTSQQL